MAVALFSSSTIATPTAATSSYRPHLFNGQYHYYKEDGHHISNCPKKKAKDARDIKLREQQELIRNQRKLRVGTGACAKKIRTYNYKDNRVSDHRLKMNFELTSFLDGDIETIVQVHLLQNPPGCPSRPSPNNTR
ncbi:unnamed protein product [Ilex paraguariensis]|uniref:Uncharacterized protein n=1 Tax=Ilex paraguariensis TaxID=185542 RepID=A0ABC8SXG4_9AQUA